MVRQLTSSVLNTFSENTDCIIAGRVIAGIFSQNQQSIPSTLQETKTRSLQKQRGYRRPDSAVTQAVNFSKQPKDWKAKTCQSGGKKKKKEKKMALCISLTELDRCLEPMGLVSTFCAHNICAPFKSKSMERQISQSGRGWLFNLFF